MHGTALFQVSRVSVLIAELAQNAGNDLSNSAQGLHASS
jgi:hypothetical protein